MYTHEIDISNKYDKSKLLELLNKLELNYDKNCDYTVGLYNDDDKLIGTVSKDENILKCFGVDKEYQKMGVTNKLLTLVHNKLIEENYTHQFIFTKIENKEIFESLGYKKIANTDKVILLEYGSENIDKFISNLINKFNIDINKKRAMIVMNCNPFTYGHRYLIEKASKENEEVIVFILEENKSTFSFKSRKFMLEKGISDLDNVKVVPTGKYIISSATFPTYFLKEKTEQLQEYIKLDSEIIINKFCKKLNISIRYLGTEDYCSVTSEYNKYILNHFSEKGIKVKIIPRLKKDGEYISASKVRKMILAGDIKEIKKYVPDSTYNYIKSSYDKGNCNGLK